MPNPIHALAAFEERNSKFKQKGKWEEVRKGRVEGLHLLASPEDPADNKKALVIDFGEIFSLPPEYLRRRAEQTREDNFGRVTEPYGRYPSPSARAWGHFATTEGSSRLVYWRRPSPPNPCLLKQNSPGKNALAFWKPHLVWRREREREI
jgi:hypothetical protein